MDEIKDLNKEHCEVMASNLIEEKEKKSERNDEKVWTIFLISVFIFLLCIASFIIISEIIFNKRIPVGKLIFIAILIVFSLFFISISIENRRIEKIHKKNLIALQNDKEYQLAKEIMKKYNKKVLEVEEKEAIERRNIQYKATLEREKEKTERMIKMKEYLKGSES